MASLLSQLNVFVSSLFGLLNLFFDLIFNRIQFFDVGVGWYAIIFSLLSLFIYGILGAIKWLKVY